MNHSEQPEDSGVGRLDDRDAVIRPHAAPATKDGSRAAVRAVLALLVFSGIFFAFAAGMLVQRVFVGGDVEAAEEAEVVAPEIFDRAWEIVEEQYVDPTAIDEERMLEAAIDGMLDTLGDEGHTRYMTAEEARAHAEDLAGEFVGVGIRVEVKDDRIVVVAPIDNSPAMEAGIQPGDILLSVNGQDISGMPIDDVVNMIRGEEGTDVTLTFNRPTEQEPLTFTLTRRAIEVSPVSWVMLEGNIADIRLSQFSSGAAENMAEAIQEAEAAGAEGFILDLRNNPGGFVHEAMQIASMFVPEGSTIYISQFRGGEEQPHTTVDVPVNVSDMPLVVLINEGSASSAEIVSGAVKVNHPNATVVGTTTFGTGTVLSNFDLGEEGGNLLLGTELWLTPEGDMIRDRGVRPDVIVELPEGVTPFVPVENAEMDVETIEDNQVDWALDLLRPTTSDEPTASAVPPAYTKQAWSGQGNILAAAHPA